MIFFAWVGCADEGKGGDSGTPTADGPVRYAQIEELFARNCATGGCHLGPQEDPVNPDRSTGLDLSSGVAFGQLVDVPSHEVPGLVRVAPGDPDASYLFHKLSGTQYDVGGYGDVMPPGFGLAANDLALVERWIAEGALGAPR